MLTRLKVSGFKNLVDVDVQFGLTPLLFQCNDLLTSCVLMFGRSHQRQRHHCRKEQEECD